MNVPKKHLGLIWWLWYQVIHPAYYQAIFMRFRRTPIIAKNDYALVDALQLLLKIVAVLGLIYIVWRSPILILTIIFIPPIIGMGIIFLPLIAPVISILFGMLIAVNIASTLKSERSKFTYELVTSTPSGALPTNWYAATGLLYRGQYFTWLNFMMRVAMWIPIIITFVIGGLILLFFRTPTVVYMATQFFYNILILTGAIYISYMQLILVSILVGLLIPTYDDLPPDEMRFGTLFAYMMIQLGSYTVTGFTIVLMHIAYYGQYYWLDWLLPIAYFGIAYLMMEIVVRSLFRVLAYRLNASLEEDLAIISARTR